MASKIYSQRERTAGAILILTGAIAYSAKAIFVKLAYQDPITPAALLTLRMLFSAPFYVVILKYNRRSFPQTEIRRSDQIQLIICGLLGYYAASLLDFVGLQYISASLERIILYSYPAIVVVASAAFKGRPIAKKQIYALTLTYLGLVLVCFNDFHTEDKAALTGILLIFGCAICYSAYLIGSEHLIPKFGATAFTSYALLSAVAGVLVHFAVTSEIEQLALPSSRVAMLAFFMAIVSTVLPSYMLSAGIARVGASPAAILSTVGPVSTIFLAFLVLGESISALQVAGAILIIVGVLRVSP